MRTPCRLLSLTLAAATALAAITLSTASHAQDTLEKARAAGEISIAIGNAPPWAELGPDGAPKGAAPEVAVEALKRLGIAKVNATVIDYGAMIPALNAGQFDVVAAGLYLNPDRCAAVVFSEPDLCDSAAFIVKKGNPLNLKTYQDVAAHPEAKLATCGGCVEEGYARDAGIPDDRLVLIGDEQSAMELLKTGRVDVYGYPAVSSATLLKKAGPDVDLEIVAPIADKPVGCGGAVFRKADASFRDAYDKELAAMKSDGAFDKIMTTYGFPTAEPKTLTRVELCKGPN